MGGSGGEREREWRIVGEKGEKGEKVGDSEEERGESGG